MKSNKGFTLIELLAVIVILAIIALIATPIILNVIDTARKGAKESSALGYVDAVEKQVMLAEVDTAAVKIPTSESGAIYSVESLTNAGVEVKGEAPKTTDNAVGFVTIDKKGAVTAAWLEYDNYKVYYDGTKATAGSTFKETAPEAATYECTGSGTVTCAAVSE